MSSWGKWLESQVSDAAPNRTCELGESAQHVRGLADACVAIERGSGAIYGVSFDRIKHAEMVPLLPRLHAGLAQWGAVLEEVFGIEGQQLFVHVCNAAGVVVTASEPVVESEDSFPELDGFRADPGDLATLNALARYLSDRGDPIGAHIHNAIELEALHRGDPRFFELSRLVGETEAREHHRMMSVVWPRQFKPFTDFIVERKRVYFRRGLPISVMLDAHDLGRFEPAVWGRAPIADAHLMLYGNETIDDSLANHPALARATSLAIGFEVLSKTDLGPLLGRDGIPLEALSFVWTNARGVAQLRTLRSPGALRTLSLASGYDGNERTLTAADIDGLADLGLTSLRELVLTRVRLKEDGVEALSRTGWPLETFELHLSAVRGSISALAESSILSNVKTLVLRGSKLGKGVAAALASSKHLRQVVCLDLHQSDDLDGFVEALELPNLRSLRLELDGRRSAVVARSDAMSNIIELDFSSGRMGDEGIVALAKAPHLRALRLLSVRGNAITDVGARAIVKAPWFGQLERLDIAVNKLGADAATLRSAFEAVPGTRELVMDP
jgi:hypothetical protein